MEIKLDASEWKKILLDYIQLRGLDGKPAKLLEFRADDYSTKRVDLGSYAGPSR